MLNFNWNGIKVNGKLYRAHYSNGELINYPKGTITVYFKDCTRFPAVEGLTVHNDTDSRIDYFENDRIRIEPTNKYYTQAQAAVAKQDEHNKKRYEKLIEKRG